MKKIMRGITVITVSLFSVGTFANEKYDLKCTLDSGEEMTVSHSSDTVYIGFEKPGADSEEGGESIIKLEVSSGGVKQELTEAGMKYPYFTLTGTDEEIDGKVIVDYNTDENFKTTASFSHIDSKGNQVSKSHCKPKTIEIKDDLPEKGIISTKTENNTTNTNTNTSNDVNDDNKAQSEEPPYKLTVSTEIIKIGTPYGRWKYEIRSNVDGLTVKNVTVNRGKCKVAWYTNPNNLKWDDTTKFGVTTDYEFSTCKPREVIVETNYGVETFRWK